MELTTWILGLISAFLAVKWQTSAKENESLKQKLNGKKEELYTEFVSFYMSLLNGKKRSEEELQQAMRAFNEKMILTASNEVFLTFGDLMQSFYKSNGEDTMQGIRLMGELILSMRKDLGHSDWMNNLYWFDSLRPWLKDVDKFVTVKYRGNRRHYNKTVDLVK
ncbi:hypothetical protein K9N08_01920 [Candidatus Gracilibacteria bacterium]|nr:hypothetical protein [Candidatus Gracilibacteria bacterium]MCF7896650.1 hypothetical protein [Candidatus Gracilibacteria bacterium]